VSYEHLGCYKDAASRALQYGPGGADITIDACHEWSAQNGYSYFALQHGGGSDKGECRCSDSLSDATRYGSATNCEAGTGGGWANDLYRNSDSFSGQEVPAEPVDVRFPDDPWRVSMPIDVVDDEPASWTLVLTAKDLAILVLVVINVVAIVVLCFVCSKAKGGKRRRYQVVRMKDSDMESEEVALQNE